MDVTIEEITVDVEIVGRSNGLDFVTVQTYADRMEAGDVFPPIKLVSDGDVFWLVDGQHRIEAAKKVNSEKIEANVTHGDRWDALEMSGDNNADNGRPRTNEDKRQKVLMFLEGERWKDLSSCEIARKCKVSDVFVAKMKGLTPNVWSEKTERTYTTKHGTIATMDTTNIGSNNKEQKPKQIQIQSIKPAVKDLWWQYHNLLLKANIISKTIAVNYEEYDIRVTLEDDSFLRESIGKAVDLHIDFIEGVKNGFQSKSN